MSLFGHCSAFWGRKSSNQRCPLLTSLKASSFILASQSLSNRIPLLSISFYPNFPITIAVTSPSSFHEKLLSSLSNRAKRRYPSCYNLIVSDNCCNFVLVFPQMFIYKTKGCIVLYIVIYIYLWKKNVYFLESACASMNPFIIQFYPFFFVFPATEIGGQFVIICRFNGRYKWQNKRKYLPTISAQGCKITSSFYIHSAITNFSLFNARIKNKLYKLTILWPPERLLLIQCDCYL